MATKKGDFYGQIRITVGYNIAYDIMDDVTWHHVANDVMWRHLGSDVMETQYLDMMAENAKFLSLCAGDSQAWNPIGSVLVYLICDGQFSIF